MVREEKERLDSRKVVGLKRAHPLVSFSLNNPHFISVVCLLVLLLGGIAAFILPKDLLPSANFPAVQILSFYPGMPVNRVEKNLTARFERYTGQATGLSSQESRSLLGVSIVRNFFRQDSDLNSAIAQTTSMSMSVLSRLPPGTQPPLIIPFDPMASVPLGLVAVSGDTSETNLYDKARYEVRNAVQSVPGAIAPTVMGGSERQVVVYLDQKKLRRYNFSPFDVMEKISGQNTFIPTGNIKIKDYDFQITSNAIVDDVKKMDDFPLRSENGVEVDLKDVGHAEDASKIQTNIVTVNGKRQVYVPLYRQPGANSFEVITNVKESIKALEERLQGIKLTLIADQSKYIRHAIRAISEEACIGGFLAILLVFFFLGDSRTTICLFLCLPISILFSFIALQATGQSINAMTLGGLAVSIGIIVDNAIVVLENISKKIEEGYSPRDAALFGASEMATPVLAASLATLVVLFPIIFLSGTAKILFSALAKAKVAALIGSYFAAMCVVPLFASKTLRVVKGLKKSRLHFHAQKWSGFLESKYENGLRKALARKGWVIGIVFCLVVVSFSLLPLLGTEYFPRADAGSLIFEFRQSSGTRIEETEKKMRELEAKLRRWIDPSDTQSIIGNAGVAYGYSAAFTPNSGPQDLFFVIELTEDRKHTSQYYAKVLRRELAKEYPLNEIGIELGGLTSSALNNGLKSPIDIQVHGPVLETSHHIATELADRVRKIRGAVDVRVQQRLDTPQLNLSMDRKKALTFGLNPEEIVKNVVSAVSGSSTFFPTMWIDPKTGVDYPLGVQFPEYMVSSVDQLKNISITGRHQDRGILLKDVANVEEKQGVTEIHHVNLGTVVDLYLDAQDRDIGGLSQEIQKNIERMVVPAGYNIEIKGEIAQMKESVSSLGSGFLLAAILVYLILVVQFRSFSLPLVIMVTVPLGLIGVILSLYFTHTYFSIQAAIGAILMVGISVANGVLLVEFMAKQFKKNPNDLESIVSGAKARLRPVMMTSFASILGTIPMAIGMGVGSEANIPLGRTVVGGQLVSTILTLFLVPIFFQLVVRRRLKSKPVLEVEQRKRAA